MPPRKKNKTPSVYEGKWTPLFEDVPTGMLLIDRAVYGFIVRMEQMEAKKSTASAATIGSVIGANEKTVDRTLSRLEQWKVIKCIYRGKTKKEPSHYVSMPRNKWDEETINQLAQNKTEKRKMARVNLSNTRVNLSEDKGQFVQDKGQIDPQRDMKRVFLRESKRVPPGKSPKGKDKKSSSSSSPSPQAAIAGANKSPSYAGYTKLDGVPYDGTVQGAMSLEEVRRVQKEWDRKQKGVR